VKYPPRSPEKRADPVVYLAGEPGDIALLEVNGSSPPTSSAIGTS
jgi:hypothetical protein